MNNLPDLPPAGENASALDLLALLEKFVPERHGGEVLAVAPVGQEFGSQDQVSQRLGSKDTKPL